MWGCSGCRQVFSNSERARWPCSIETQSEPGFSWWSRSSNWLYPRQIASAWDLDANTNFTKREPWLDKKVLVRAPNHNRILPFHVLRLWNNPSAPRWTSIEHFRRLWLSCQGRLLWILCRLIRWETLKAPVELSNCKIQKARIPSKYIQALQDDRARLREVVELNLHRCNIFFRELSKILAPLPEIERLDICRKKGNFKMTYHVCRGNGPFQ